MGLKRAAFEIYADDRDITGLILDRFLSLEHKDSAGDDSDTITLSLDNRDGAIALPETGSTLSVSMGYKGALVFKGHFAIDELVESLSEYTLEIHGKAANMKSSFKAPRTESYHQITLGDLVQRLAGRNGYQASVAADLSGILLPHLDQHAEADMNLLTRVARDHGAVVKPVNNRLMVLRRDQAKTASGQDFPKVVISDPWNSTGTVSTAERSDYKSVMTYWHDEAKGERVGVLVGNGEPRYTDRHPYASEEKARIAGEAKLKGFQRGRRTLNLVRPLMAEVVAEGPIELARHVASANGEWIVDDVTHAITGQAQVGQSTITAHTPQK